jgi:hypothetical protein
MTDDQLTRLWRNTERFAEASMAVAVLLGVAAVWNDWPKWTAFVFLLPLLVASAVAHFACLWVLRPWLDRRGLDWEAPVWWAR